MAKFNKREIELFKALKLAVETMDYYGGSISREYKEFKICEKRVLKTYEKYAKWMSDLDTSADSL